MHLPNDSLESPDSLEAPVTAYTGELPGVETPAFYQTRQLLRFNKTALIVSGVAVLMVAVIGAAVLGFGVFAHNKKDGGTQNAAQNYPITTLPVSSEPDSSLAAVGQAAQLSINGQLTVGNTLVLTPTKAPKHAVKGQVYYDTTTNAPYYFDGTKFVSLTPQDYSALLAALNQRVLSLQGQVGGKTLTAGRGIVINGTTISSSDIATITGLNGLTVTKSGPAVALSLPQQLGVGNVPTFGGLNLTGPLGLTSGGTGTNGASFANGGVFYYDGSGFATTATPATAGLCLVSTSNGPGFDAAFGSCTGGANVTSVNGVTGSVVLNNATANTGTGVITVDNASTSTKGIAQFSPGDFIVTGGTVSLGANVAQYNDAVANFTGTLQHNGNAVCDTSGNCAGIGGAVTTTGGTPGTIAVWDSAGGGFTLTDSLLKETGSTVSVTGTVAATNLQGNGAAVTNVNAAQLQGQNGAYYLALTNATGTLADNHLSANVAKYNDTTANFTGTLQHNGNAVCDTSGNCIGSGGAVSSTGTTGHLALYGSDGYHLIDSILGQSGTLLTASGQLTVTGSASAASLSTSGNLTVTGSASASSLTLSGGVTAATVTLSGLLSGTTGSFSGTVSGANAVASSDFVTLSQLNSAIGGVGGVTSLNSLSGNLTLQGTPSQITITDNGADTLTVALNSSVTVQGNTFNGPSQLVRLDASSKLPAVDASQLTNLSASNVASGTLGDGRLSTNVALLNGSNNGGVSNFTGGLQQNGNDVCTTAGNCVGSGSAGSALGGSGTTNHLAVFTGAGTVGSSVLEEISGNIALGVSGTPSSLLSIGGATGSLTVDASGNLGTTGTLTLSSLTGGASTCLTLSASHQVGTATCATGSGSNPTLQDVYDNSATSPVIDLNTASGGGIAIQDAATSVGGNLFSVTNNDGSATYFAVTTSGANVAGTFSANSLSGDGAAITNVDAAQLNGQLASYYLALTNATGTLADNHLSANVAKYNDTTANFTGTLQHNGNAVCDTSGNCIGSGGAVSSTGTTGHLALYGSDGYHLIDSILGQSGTTVTVTGTVAATTLQGDGSTVTNVDAAQLNGQAASYYLNATNINTGTLADVYLSANVAKYNDTTANFTGTLQENGNDVCTTAGNCVGSSAGLGGNGTPGTIAVWDPAGTGFTLTDSSLSQDVSGNVTVTGNLAATALQGDGSAVTNVDAAQLNGQAASYYLNADNITAGTLADARLSANIAKYDDVIANFTGTLQHNGNAVCDAANNCGYLTGSAASGSYVQLQGSTPGAAQTGNFNISGTGTASILQGTTRLMTPSLDTASTGALSIGNTNATTINIATNNADHTIQIGSDVSGHDQYITMGNIYGGSSTSIQGNTLYLGGNNVITTAGNEFLIKDSLDNQLLIIETQYNLTTIKTDLQANGNASILGDLGVNGGGEFGEGITIDDPLQTYTSPLGTSLQTAINVTNQDLNAFGSVLALGVTSGSAATARGIIIADARTGTHQPTIAVLSPDESQTFGLSWDGSNNTALLKSGTDIGIAPAGSTVATFTNASIALGQNVTVAAGKTLTLAGGATAGRPVSPTAGTMYYDTTTNQLLTYNGTKWIGSQKQAIIVAASDSSQADKDAADYVATGSDDGATVNTAIAALPTSGGTVYLMPGTYLLGSTGIQLDNNETLAGAGAGTLLTWPNGANYSTTAIGNSDWTTGTGVTVRDLMIDGNKANQTSGSGTGIALYGMGSGSGTSALPGATIDNVIVKNMGSYGISLSGANSVVTDSQAFNDGIYGIAVSSNSSMITGNTSQGNNHGIYLSGNNDSVTGNTSVENTTNGLTINGTNNTITGNTVLSTNTTANGISLGSGGGDTVTGNTISISGTTTKGMNVSSGNNTITGNTLTGGDEGIYMNGSNVVNNNVSNNIIESASFAGLYITSSANNNTVASNTIYDTGGSTGEYGIYLLTASNNRILDNTISDASCTGVCAGIDIIGSSSVGNYLSDNYLKGDGTHTSMVSDNGTGTIYDGQMTSSAGSSFQYRVGADTTTAFTVQNASGAALLTADTTNMLLTVSGGLTVTGNVAYQKGTDYSATGITNNVNFGTGALFRLTGASTQTITGIAGGTNGRMITLINAASQAAILSNSSTSSSSGNRIITGTGGDYTISAGSSVSLVYDSGSSVWRLVGAVAGAVGGGSYVTLQGSTPGTADIGNLNITGVGVYGSGANTITLSPTSGITLAGTARNSKVIRLAAEYENTVLDAGTASNNAGTMTSGFDLSNRMNYYKWTTDQATNQSYDVVVQVPIPKDFSAWSSNPLAITSRTSDTTNGTVQLAVVDSAGTTVCNFVNVTPGSTGTWATNNTACTLGTGTYTAGDYLTLRIRLQSPSGGDVRIGNITLSYLSNK